MGKPDYAEFERRLEKLEEEVENIRKAIEKLPFIQWGK